MTNVIEVDFMEPSKRFEMMMNEALNRYVEPELLLILEDTSIHANDNSVIIKVSGETKLSFLRKDGGLAELVEALKSLT